MSSRLGVRLVAVRSLRFLVRFALSLAASPKVRFAVPCLFRRLRCRFAAAIKTCFANRGPIAENFAVHKKKPKSVEK